jgi:hypothetical protein
MMDDHETLSQARQELAAALTCLLKTGIMDAYDFGVARGHVRGALESLDALLQPENLGPYPDPNSWHNHHHQE